MRLSLTICLLMSALVWAACTSPATESAAETTHATDSLSADTSDLTTEVFPDSLPPAGHAGLRFGGNVSIGGTRKPLPSSLDAALGKPGHFQRRSPTLGLPNRGVFHSRYAGKTTDTPTESPWDAYLACDAADAPAPVSLTWEEAVWVFESEKETLRLPFKESPRIFITRCGTGESVHIWDAYGRPVNPKNEVICPKLADQSWNGPMLCVAQKAVELRFVCGNRLVALAQGAFQEFDLQGCGVAIELLTGELRLYSACAVEPVSCD